MTKGKAAATTTAGRGRRKPLPMTSTGCKRRGRPSKKNGSNDQITALLAGVEGDVNVAEELRVLEEEVKQETAELLHNLRTEQKTLVSEAKEAVKSKLNDSAVALEEATEKYEKGPEAEFEAVKKQYQEADLQASSLLKELDERVKGASSAVDAQVAQAARRFKSALEKVVNEQAW